MASTAEKLDLELWEEAKADARDAYGGHSARAMQYASKLYKARGGRYKGRKRADNRLTQWTRQDWTTKSGRPSRETGERYLPRAAIESLSSAEYGATTRAKRRGGGVGSVVAQPRSIREKTRKFRKVNPIMATPAQIAARKKFAERARSGELAKMRKKATKRNPAKTVSEEISRQVRKGKPQKQAVAIALEMEREGKLMKNPIQTFSVQLSDKKLIKTVTADSFDDALEMAVGRRFFSASSDSYRRSGDVTTDKFFNVMVKDPNGTTTYRDGKRLIRLKQIRAQVSLFEIPKRNPVATRAPARSRTKLVSNGREKNPIHGYIVRCGRSGRVLGYADTLPMAKAMATSIANDRNMQVKIEKN